MNCVLISAAGTDLATASVPQLLVAALFAVGGVLAIRKGIGGIRDQRLVGKRGRVLEGGSARLLGVGYVALGAVVLLVCAGIVCLKLLRRG